MNDISASEKTRATPVRAPALDRPFHFVVVLWGEQFRDYFLEYCLPSLLSPNNIPALSTRTPSKFLIATLADDWAKMQASAVFKELARHLVPVFVEIPPCPSNRSGREHMGIGHKRIAEISHREGAYGVHLTPDCMLSDGTVLRLAQLAAEGRDLVLTAALRFGEEPFLGMLKTMGAVPAASRRDSGRALTISGRQMVCAAVNGFHTQTLSYEWDRPNIIFIQPAAWWRVLGEEGVLIHSLSWAPLLLDYAAVRELDSSALENWTLDGDYVFKNLGRSDAIYVSQDSDEMFIASWAPLADRPVSLARNRLFWFPRLARAIKVSIFRHMLASHRFDPLKQRFFFLPVRWHANALNSNWDAADRRAAETLLSKLDPSEISSPPGFSLKHAVFELLQLGDDMRVSRQAVSSRIGLALRGDAASIKRIGRRIKSAVRHMLLPKAMH